MPGTPEFAVERYRTRPETVATDRGDGSPLLLSHGTLMDRTMFAPQVDALADDRRVVAYDSRARTDCYGGPDDLYDLADDCAALMDGLGIESAVLGGMSMGGFMALRFAERYPERVEGLVLVATTAGPHDADERERYREMIETCREAGRVPAQLAEVVSHILFGATTVAAENGLVERWMDRWQTYPGAAVFHEVEAWLDRPDFTPTLADIEVPALVINGEEDVTLEPSRSEPLAEHLDAERVVVPDAGHTVTVETPEPVTEAIREFCARVS